MSLVATEPKPIDVLNVAPLSATGSVVPSPTIISPSLKTAIAVTAPVPEPNKTPPSVRDDAPEPPFATGNIPVTSVVNPTCAQADVPVPVARNTLFAVAVDAPVPIFVSSCTIAVE